MKVVINSCYGGFGLSDAGMRRYAELKGITLYPELDKRFSSITTYWTVPEDQRVPEPSPQQWAAMSPEECRRHNEAYSATHIYDRDIPRDDAAIVQAVEELGAAANGKHARLTVVEIPDDAQWQIEEYDGCEHVAEKHRTWP